MKTKNRILSAFGVLSIGLIAWCVIFIQSDNASVDAPQNAPAAAVSEIETPQSKTKTKEVTSATVSMSADFIFVDSKPTAPESAQPQK